MTQEEKQLLLKDLCARLPYKVILNVDNGKYREDKKIWPDLFNSDTLWDAKPYLRPMSSMTEKERKIVNKLIYNKESIWTSPIPVWVIDESDIEKYIDFCNSHHLDYRGLIPMGLALEAPEDMYKTE